RRYGSAETGLDFAPVNGILVHDGLRKTPNRSRLDDVARRFPLRLNPDVLLQSLNHCAVARLSFVPVEIPNSARTAALSLPRPPIGRRTTGGVPFNRKGLARRGHSSPSASFTWKTSPRAFVCSASSA